MKSYSPALTFFVNTRSEYSVCRKKICRLYGAVSGFVHTMYVSGNVICVSRSRRSMTPGLSMSIANGSPTLRLRTSPTSHLGQSFAAARISVSVVSGYLFRACKHRLWALLVVPLLFLPQKFPPDIETALLFGSVPIPLHVANCRRLLSLFTPFP